MFDRQRIERAGFKEALQQMPAALLIAEAPSGKILFVNRQTQQWTEEYVGQSIPSELGYLGDLQDVDENGISRIRHPDGRPYEMGEWPLMRSITSGEEVRDWEYFYTLADGTHLWFRANSSPIYDEEGRIVAGVLVTHDITEPKMAEEELRESRRRTENILESITDEFAAVDREWRYTYLNERALRRIQTLKGEELTREEVLGKNMWEEFPEAVGSVFYHKYHEAMREQKTVEFEAYYPLSDRWIEIHAYPSEEGLVVYAHGITERKRAEEELHQTEGRFKGTFEQAAVGIGHVDLEGHFLRLNEKFCEIIGYEQEELLELSFQDITHPEDLERDLEEFRQLLAGEIGTYSIEKRYIRKDSSIVWVNLTVSLVRKAAGEPNYIVGVIAVITERKRAKKEIETRTRQQAAVAELGLQALAEQTNLQALMDEAVACVARTLDVEYSEIVEILPSGEELLIRAGVGWEEGIVGNTTVSAGFGSQAGYALLSEEPVIVEDFSTETRFDPPALLQEHGAVSGMSVVIYGQEEPFGVLCADTTSRRTFTEDDVNFLQALANVLATAIERKEAQERLEKVRELERSRIARDLHDEALQDLSGALVEAQILRRSVSTEDPEAARQAEQLLATLDRIGPRLRGAVYDLRLEAEQERPFSELLQALVELQRTISTECEISLEMRGELLSGSLGKTGGELLRIVREALINARRHSGAQHARVSVWASEERLWAEVEDDGRGFETPQGEPSAPTSGGMGIRGMRERARALGGELKIKSEPDKGTKVSFELAFTKEPEVEPGGEEEEVRIVLVDDHASIREALASTFEGEGFEVVGQAGSLAEARQMLEEAQQEIDVALLDLGLADGYGGDLIEELREKNPQAQALVLSASLDQANTARAVEQGAARVLNKTAHLDKVVEAVRRLRAGETLMPLEEVVELLRFAGRTREHEYEARQTIEKLTIREREVLQALAEGLDSEGIAEKLHISLRTQRNHMSSILAKLGVHSQLQALVFALRHGVVEIR